MIMYKMKEKKILMKIGQILNRLDLDLKNIDTTRNTSARIQLKKIFLERRALLKIKREVTKAEATSGLILTRLSETIWEADTELLMAEAEETREGIFLLKWRTYRESMHEIKYLIHRAGFYDRFDANELNYLDKYEG